MIFRPRASLPDTIRIAVGGCAHAPLHDKDAVRYFCDQILDFKPHVVVLNGDARESDAASQWPSEYPFSLMDEYRILDQEVYQPICDAGDSVGVSEFIENEGNHDFNIRSEGRIAQNVRALCDYREPQFVGGEMVNRCYIERWSRGHEYENCPVRGVLRFGQVAITHGYACSKNSDEQEAILLGCHMGLTVRSHTHRPVRVTQAVSKADIDLPYWYANTGCLRDLSPSYMGRKRKEKWGHGCVLIEADLRCGPHKSLRASRQWEAETRIKSLYPEWASKKYGEAP